MTTYKHKRVLATYIGITVIDKKNVEKLICQQQQKMFETDALCDFHFSLFILTWVRAYVVCAFQSFHSFAAQCHVKRCFSFVNTEYVSVLTNRISLSRQCFFCCLQLLFCQLCWKCGDCSKKQWKRKQTAKKRKEEKDTHKKSKINPPSNHSHLLRSY